jgi:C_GCAxxG_C_C family probable redox protein
MENACKFQSDGLAAQEMRMLQRVQQGFHCSEILLFAGLEAQGKINPDLIKAVSGLAGGVGFSGELCGALTGGACLLGLYCGRGDENEIPDPRLNIMVGELVDWFSEKFGGQYGGNRCSEIILDDPRNQPERCPRIVSGVLKKVKSLLSEHGFEWERPSSSCRPNSTRVAPEALASASRPDLACPCAAGTR